ncbi:hypothetical protein BT96DRAFT_944402 [Gymnopus androsaceus JB14]|uniref:Uncharacterized protein n=1 Tax=Gymnopus androsaceus JB14 TaxID=1447944 RepID=A0A6A4H4Q6_9AGAR|nr:hypothetical protein BT96DRAFT_944402 [Gymnopus androsaceus JB14]
MEHSGGGTLAPEDVYISAQLSKACVRLDVPLYIPIFHSAGIALPTPSDTSCSGQSDSEIVWSCLTTIFACTWVAVHPNIPALDDSGGQLLWRRVKILAVALIAPEFIIIWAANQLRSARSGIAELRNFPACSDWTLTHGMFLVMGGFMLTSTSGQRIGVLQADDLHLLLSKDLISLPSIPCSEIMDRSKGDALGKTLALVQTTWFMAQVISRGVQHLPITELELTTAAFAFLNFLTYALWWKKPLDVRHPILVQLRDSDYSNSASHNKDPRAASFETLGFMEGTGGRSSFSDNESDVASTVQDCGKSTYACNSTSTGPCDATNKELHAAIKECVTFTIPASSIESTSGTASVKLWDYDHNLHDEWREGTGPYSFYGHENDGAPLPYMQSLETDETPSSPSEATPALVCHRISIPLTSFEVAYAGLLTDEACTLSARSNSPVVFGAPGATTSSITEDLRMDIADAAPRHPSSYLRSSAKINENEPSPVFRKMLLQ